MPPAGNANFAWVQHFIHHLAPTGMAGFVLANGSHVLQPVRRGRNPQDHHRGRPGGLHGRPARPALLLHADPVCLWFLARDKKNGRFRDRRGETLFIDARKIGTMIDRVHRELTDEDIQKIADTYHAWRGDKECKEKYKDVPGFCKIRHTRGNSSPRPHPYTGPLRRSGRGRGRWRAVRGEDGPTDRRTPRPDREVSKLDKPSSGPTWRTSAMAGNFPGSGNLSS